MPGSEIWMIIPGVLNAFSAGILINSGPLWSSAGEELPAN
jgi:hypothetical protein